MRFVFACLMLIPAVGHAEIYTFNEFTTPAPFPQTFNQFTLTGDGSIEPTSLHDIAFQTPYAFLQLDNTHSASMVFTQDVSYWSAELDTGIRHACVLSKRLFLASSGSWLYDGINAYATLAIDDPTTTLPIDQEVRINILEGPPTFYEFNAGNNFIRSIHFTSADPDICQPLGMDNVHVVPEPAAAVLFAGLLLCGLWIRSRNLET